MSAPLSTRSPQQTAQRLTPQTGLAERQGLCHISQLLEMLFMKYGISTEEAAPDRPAEATVADENQFATALVTSVTSALPGSSVMSPANSQATFNWFQSNELTI